MSLSTPFALERARFPLGNQWPTLDPFLFVAHHRDAYPTGNGKLAPSASLAGRTIGMDFDDIDGWNMYHGSNVPGFPQHPHRGFETITYVRDGFIDHADSLGATARFGRGDTQWMTAGGGVVHAEMFPLLSTEEANPLELFQIWLNLPAANKMVDPYFTMLWSEETPRERLDTTTGAGEVTVIAGSLVGPDGRTLSGQAPPPDSWAAAADNDVAIWHLSLQDGASVLLPPAATRETRRVIYGFEGDGVVIETAAPAEPERIEVGPATGVEVMAERAISIASPPSGVAELLVLQGRPIAEPIARYGPFVMNTKAEIDQAFSDYQRTRFGGWPWPSDDPTHPADAGRFARHADGTVEDRDA